MHCAQYITSCFMLNALRLEKERGFKSWLITMGSFTCWKIIHLGYGTIVNDLYFSYHIFTFFTWILFTLLSTGSLAVIYSLYLELTSISKLEDMARFKMDTMSTRGNSVYGSRPTTPHGTLARPVSRQPSLGESLYSVHHEKQPDSLYRGGTIYSGGTSLYSARVMDDSLYSSTPREGPVTQFGANPVSPENIYSRPEHSENVYASLQRNQEQIYATIIN